MIKVHKKTLILTSIVILLPILMGLFLWNQLPEQLPIHWNAQGAVDGYASKAFAVFGLPIFLLLIQWFCTLLTQLDPKAKAGNRAILSVTLWIIPVLSVLMTAIIYFTTIGLPIRVEIVIPLVMGLLFTILGNYMPKTQRNYTIGLKLPWTLESDENWNKTHRLAGKLWVAGGIMIILTAFLALWWLFFSILALMVLIPTIYSYSLYHKANK